MEIYLTPELKSYYTNDFNNNVLTETDPFWKLDDGVKDFLITINSNPNIQTLFSKKKQFSIPSSENESYVQFCYFQKLEQKLFKNIISDLSLIFNYDSEEKFYYNYEFPKENNVYSKNTASLLGCRNNKDFFLVNSIVLTFESWDENKHDIFFNEVEKRLSNI